MEEVPQQIPGIPTEQIMGLLGWPVWLCVIGALLGIIAGLWLLVAAFRASVWWGLACLLLPGAALVFVFVRWGEAAKPFLASLLATGLIFTGFFMIAQKMTPDNPELHALAREMGVGEFMDEAGDFGAPVLPEPTPVDRISREEAAELLSDLRRREADLKARKEALAPDDEEGKLRISKEIVSYNRELEDALKLTAPYRKRKSAGESAESQPTEMHSPQSGGEFPGGLSGGDAGDGEGNWTMEMARLSLGSGPLKARIAGDDVILDHAKLANGILTLRKGEEFFSDAELMIFLFLNEGESPAGRTFTVGEGSPGGNPHVHMKWKALGDKLPRSEAYMDDYVMKLVFGPDEGEMISGQIHVCLPDDRKSYAVGSFRATVDTAF